MFKRFCFIISLLILVNSALIAQCSFDPCISGVSITGILTPCDDGTAIVGYLENHFFPNTDDEDNPVIINVCFEHIAPKGGTSTITGTISNKFTWSYDQTTNCLQGVQNQDIAANESGTVEFDYYQVTQFGCPSQTMKFNAFITAPICAVNNNFNNDTLNVSTCVQCMDFKVNFTGSNASCGQGNGILSANVAGGDGNYFYQWSNGSNSSSISNLPAGTHTVTISDGGNCLGVFHPVVSFNDKPVIEWSGNFGGSGSDIPYSITQHSDGGFIAVGFTGSNNFDVGSNNGMRDYWICKVDAAGTIVWTIPYGGSLIDVATDIKETKDGGIIVVGRSASSDGDVTVNNGGNDVWVLKIDYTGGLEWERSFGGSDEDTGSAIFQTIDKGYIVGGTTRSTNGDVSSNNGANDMWIIKLDQEGNLVWENTYGGTQNDYLEDIRQTSDNGFIAVGNTDSNNGDVSGNHGGDDFWVIKIDANGNLQWQNALGGSLNERGLAIIQTIDGGYITTGISNSIDGDVSGNKGGTDFCIFKLDAAGTLLWNTTFGGSMNDTSFGIKQLINGTYITVGTIGSNDGDITQNYGSNDAWVVQFDGSGAIVWEQNYGGSGDDSGFALDIAKDGGLVLAGTSKSSDIDVPANYGGNDFWIVKLTAPPTITLSCNVLDQGTGNNDGVVEYTVLNEAPPYTLQVLDPNNVSVSITNLTQSIDTLENLIPGTYLFEVTDANGCLATCSFYICDLQADLFTTNTTCNEDNGSISATIAGGDGNYTVLWSNGATSTTINNVPKGTYSVTITDGAGCVYVATTVVSFSEEPSIVWEKNFGGSQFDYGFAFTKTVDGGYIMTGTTRSNDIQVSGNHGLTDFWVVKVDAGGQLQWQKALGGTQAETAYEIHQMPDQGYIVAGLSSSSDGDVAQNNGQFDYWVVKLNSIGTILWEKNYGGTGGDVARAIKPTTDGGFILGGYSNSTNGDVTGNKGQEDYWVVKVDNLGDIQWQKTYGGSGIDLGTAIINTSDGGYFMTGFSDSNNGDVSGNHGSEDIWAIKLSADGAIEWQNSLGGSDNDQAFDCVQTKDDGFLIQGQTFSSDGDVSINKGGVDYWLVKLDVNGMLQWEKTYGGSGTDGGLAIMQSDADEIYISGGSWSVGGDVSNNIGKEDFWIAKLNSLGGIIWEKSFGGTESEYCYQVDFAHDGGLILLGYTASNDVDVAGNNGFEDFWLIKVDYSEMVVSNDSLNGTCFGASEGNVDVKVDGGTPPYLFTWSNGANTDLVTGLAAGIYTLTVTDSENCTVTYSVDIFEAPEIIYAVSGVTNAGCDGNSGQATVSLPSWSGIETDFEWSNGYSSSIPYIATSTATGLSPGTYTITITDADYNCSTVASVTIQAAVNLSVSATIVQSLDCNGDQDGVLQANSTGGTIPYTYQWGPSGATTPSISNLGAGTYTVTVTDGSSCTATTSITLTEPTLLSASIVSTDSVSCNGGNDGTATATATGGSTPYLYNWPNGATTPTASNLTQGTYIVTVTDGNGCESTASALIDAPPAISVTFTLIDSVSCNGGSDGSVQTTIGGGTPPYTYLWSNGATTQNATGLSAGTYQLTVMDSKNCSSGNVVTVNEPSVLTLSVITSTNTSCTACIGTADLQATGGTPPYTYQWSNGSTTQDVTNLCAGINTATVTDSNGCTAATSVTIGSSSTLMVFNFQVDSTISCTGVCDAVATVTATGGQPPYTYLWTDGQTTASASGLCAGTNQVTITDDNGCLVVSGTSFIDPSNIGVFVDTKVDILCFGDSTGMIEVIGSGGTPPYSFLWGSGETTALITNLLAGIHVVEIFDANGCNTLLSIQLTEPSTAVSTNIIGGVVSCNGGSDGTATAIPAGGVSPYSYNWSNGATTTTTTGLSAQSYTLTVTDANSCAVTAAITISEQTLITPIMVDSTAATCGACVGAADLDVSGGNPPYSYNWSNGSTIQDATGLCAGINTVTVTDNSGCSVTSSVSIGDIPGLVFNSINTDSLISCNGACDAGATVVVSGGQTPYTYFWSNGMTTASSTGLCGIAYQVTVTDINGCIVTGAISFVDPLQLGATVNLINDVNCFGASDGSATVVGSGGTIPYSYNWSNGETTATATNLAVGNQSVTLTDFNGCTIIESILINGPDSLGIVVDATVDASCSSCIGTADITVTGGTLPYAYLWSNGATTEDVTNLCSGVNSLTVTDANGCSKTISVNIGNSTTFGVANLGINTIISCNSVCDGSILLTLSGGQTPYTYQWSNGQSGQEATGLCAGNYTVTATDANGCSTGGTISISQPNTLSVSLVENGFIACNGNTNGSITATVTGGSPTYTYSWSNGGNTPTITGLPANTYTMTVTDLNGCSTTASIVISEPSLLSATAVEDTPASCSGNSDGAASVTATGGITPYTYLWTNGATTSAATGLFSGTNSVTVTDGNGCKVIDVFVITSLSGPAITGVSSLPTTCGNSDGQITVTTTGGTLPLTFSIDGGATTQGSNVFTGLPAMFYTVEVSDISGCVQTDTITVNDTPWNETVSFSFGHPNCGQQNGFIDITVPSGNAPFLYSINNGATTQASPQFNGLGANAYQIVVFDVNSCSIDTAVTLQTIDSPMFDSVVIKRPICGMDNGEIEIFVSLGSTPYEYSIDNGATYQPGSLFNNLAPATYDILLRDADNCVVSTTATLVDIAGPQLTFFQGITPTYCGQNIGQIIVSANGGTPPLQYSINGGSTFQPSDSFPGLFGGVYDLVVSDDNGCVATKQVTVPDLDGPELDVASTVSPACGLSDGTVTLTVINNGVAPFEYKEINGIFTSNNVFPNLPQGTYDFVVKDAKNCFDTLQVTLTDLPGPTIDQILTDDPTCGNNSGSITIAVSGPSAPFLYSIDNGASFQTSNSYTNLTSGNYSVVVKDTRGCTSSSQILLVDNGIPSIDSLLVVDPACNNFNGEVTVYASGGNPPYLYSLDGVNFQLSNIFTNLPSGPNTFYVFDTTACQTDTLITLLNLTGPTLDSIGIDHPDCGMSNGLISLFGSGGNPPYTYSIDNGATFSTTNVFSNLVPSSYLVVIKDDRDCEVSGTALLQNQTGPQIDSIIAAPSDCDTNTGSLTTFLSGGTPTYNYLWSTTPPQTASTATGLAPGQYFVTITDANNCVTVGNGQVIPPVPDPVDLGPDASYCGAQGTQLDAGPGLSYQWSTGETTQIITVNTGATYSVTVTDFYNCVSSDSLNITEIPFNPSVIADTTILLGDPVQLTASGGLSYEWWPGMDLSCVLCPDPVATPADSTTFYVEISSTNDCVDTLSVHIDLFDINNPVIEPPTVISPGNPDGMNDVWIIPGIEFYPYNRVIIVNRWGDVVFEAVPYNNDWGGTFKGNPLPQGTYYYYIELDVNKLETQKGSLTIIR